MNSKMNKLIVKLVINQIQIKNKKAINKHNKIVIN